jgi:PadR family transcriptional regulator PadR
VDAQMKRGVLEMCVLHLLADEPLYGYELMKTVQEAFPDVYDGSVYAVLRRLHADGCTETFLGETSGGPPRKYYRLTADGRRRLSEALEEWRALVAAVRHLKVPV